MPPKSKFLWIIYFPVAIFVAGLVIILSPFPSLQRRLIPLCNFLEGSEANRLDELMNEARIASLPEEEQEAMRETYARIASGDFDPRPEAAACSIDDCDDDCTTFYGMFTDQYHEGGLLHIEANREENSDHVEINLYWMKDDVLYAANESAKSELPNLRRAPSIFGSDDLAEIEGRFEKEMLR